MLILKPNCEWCNKALAPDAQDAMICSYECTFCDDCVQNQFSNVCPNCGGGLCQRPIRPSQQHRKGVSLQNHPASTETVSSPYQLEELQEFIDAIKDIPMHKR